MPTSRSSGKRLPSPRRPASTRSSCPSSTRREAAHSSRRSCVGASLLQGTTRIRFGSAVLATPLHHPVRLAEDAIMFDWITRGRLVLGLGIAHQVPDFRAYGVPRDERIEVFEEVLDLLELCFAGEPYRYQGKHFTSEAHITPRPFTLPRPEIWIGAHSQSGLERAARRADLWLADPQRDVQTIAKLAATYRRHAEELGKTPRVGIFREAWIGDSKAECERVWSANAAAGAPALLQRRHVQEALRAVGRRGRRAGELHHRPARARTLPVWEPRGRAGRGRGVAGADRLRIPRAALPPSRRPLARGDDGGPAPIRRGGDHAPGSGDDDDRSPTMTTATKLLFSPIDIAGLHLPNRIVMPAMGTGLPEHDGTCNDATIAYYRRRAEGGVGMITIEASLVSPDAYGVGPELRLHGEEYIPGLQRLVEALRPYGIPIGIQLWHPGRQTLLGEPIAPSPVPLSSRTPIPHELTREEIHTLVDYYALSAWVSQQAGFDFVEVHGAHCYLPCEFISPLSNLRTDEYGGSLENRARFPLEIVGAIRERCGTDFPVMYRISGAEGAEGGFEVEVAAEVCQMLENAVCARSASRPATGTRSTRRSARCSSRAASSSRSRPRSSAP